MQARHSHPNRPKGSVDFIKDIYQPNLLLAKDYYLAEVRWEDSKMVSVYLHRIEGLMQADSYLNEQRDTYAVVVDGPVMYAFNIGGYPEPQFFLFDFACYLTIKNKADKLQYISYSCLGSSTLSENLLVHLYDQHRKVLLDELYVKEVYS